MKTINEPMVRLRQRVRMRPREAYSEGFLVHYDGSVGGNAALRAAIERSRPETEILAVYCIVIPEDELDEQRWQGLEWRAHVYLAAALTNASLRGKTIQTGIVACGSLGEGLVEQAEQWSADIVFLGDGADADDGKVKAVADYVRRHGPAEVTLVKGR